MPDIILESENGYGWSVVPEGQQPTKSQIRTLKSGHGFGWTVEGGSGGTQPIVGPSIATDDVPFYVLSVVDATPAIWPNDVTITTRGWYRRTGGAWASLGTDALGYTIPLSWSGGDQIRWQEEGTDGDGKPVSAVSNALTVVALPALAPSPGPAISGDSPLTVGGTVTRTVGVWPSIADVVAGWYRSTDGTTWDDLESTEASYQIPLDWDAGDQIAWIEDGSDDYGRTTRAASNTLTIAASASLVPVALPVITAGSSPILAGTVISRTVATWPEGSTVTSQGWFWRATGTSEWVDLSNSGATYAIPSAWDIEDEISWREAANNGAASGSTGSNALAKTDITLPIGDGVWAAQEAPEDVDTRKTVLAAHIPQLIDKTVLVYRGDVDPGNDQLGLTLGTATWDVADARYEWTSSGLAARGSTVYVRLARENAGGGGREWISNSKSFVASNVPVAPVFSGEVDVGGNLIVTFGAPDGRGRSVTSGQYRINTGSWVSFVPASEITIADPPDEDFSLSVKWINANGESAVTTHTISAEPITEAWDVTINEPNRLVVDAVPPQPNQAVVSGETRTSFEVDEGASVGSLWYGMAMIPSADFDPLNPIGYYPNGLIVEGSSLPLISTAHADATEYTLMNFGAKAPVTLVPSLIFEDTFPTTRSGALLGQNSDTGGTWDESNLGTSLFSVSSSAVNSSIPGAYAPGAELLYSSADLTGTADFVMDTRFSIATTNSIRFLALIFDEGENGNYLAVDRSSSTVLRIILRSGEGGPPATNIIASHTISNTAQSQMWAHVEVVDGKASGYLRFRPGASGTITETTFADVDISGYDWAPGRVAIQSMGNMGNNGGGSRIQHFKVGAL